MVPHPHDISVQTFRGHTVLQTLIRAYFSPAHSTGQRFVYTGSADGTVRIYGKLHPSCMRVPMLKHMSCPCALLIFPYLQYLLLHCDSGDMPKC